MRQLTKKYVSRCQKVLLLVSAMIVVLTPALTSAETHLDSLRRAFSELRFGMFIHYGMNTFSNTSGNDLPNQNPSVYNPTNINPAQWVSAAKAAGMKYIVFTCKHHDGFCNWDTKSWDYKCTNASVPVNARKDVTKLFVQACNDSGIWPCLYYSVQDRSYGGTIGSGVAGKTSIYTNYTKISASNGGRAPLADVNFVMMQVKELLTMYGKIPFFVDDGWAWIIGHTTIPYQDFRDSLYKFSPNTLFSEHEGLFYPWQEDLIYYEHSKDATLWPHSDNIYASWLGSKMGGAWYWVPTDVGDVPGSIANYMTNCEPYWCNVTPNFGVNRDGVIQDSWVTWMKNFPKSWSPNLSRKPLPEQPPHMDYVITATYATATSGTATNAMDGISDGGFPTYYTQTLWTSNSGLPQSITIDLGTIYRSIEMCSYLPKQIPKNPDPNDKGGPLVGDSSGTITGYQISYSTNNSNFTPVELLTGSNGIWAKDTKMKYALFTPVTARYMKLTATSSIGGKIAEASELDFGGYTNKPVRATDVLINRVSPLLYAQEKGSHLSIVVDGKETSSKNVFELTGNKSFEMYSLDGRRVHNNNNTVFKLQGNMASKPYVYKKK